MTNTIIVITTRDYPCKKRPYYSYPAIHGIDECFRRNIDLTDSKMSESIQDELELTPSELEEHLDIVCRILVWEDLRASWCKDDVFFDSVKEKGFSLIKIICGKDDSKFFIYVAPCTNGRLSLQFRRDYSATILNAALEDMKNSDSYDRIVLVAHDKDLVEIDGSGLVPLSVFDGISSTSVIKNLKVLKFRHEDNDEIWKTIVRPIRDDQISVEDCAKLVSLADSSTDLFKYFLLDSVTASYEELLEHQLFDQCSVFNE